MSNLKSFANKGSLNLKIQQIKLQPKKTLFKALLVLILVELIVIGYYIVAIILNKKSLDEKKEMLLNISTYGSFQDIKDKDIKGFLDSYGKLINEKKQKDAQIEKFQSSYNNFLVNIYLPSLNIWQTPYFTGININLLGGEYIDKNPYIDINLVNKWTTFFKKIDEKGQILNEIKNIKIGEIVEDKSKGTFSMSLDVNFVAPSRRAFIMLINKLSTTSNEKNIALINEFMFNLFEVIKNKEKDVISSLGKKYNLSGEDIIIGKAFYDWINSESENPLLRTMSVGNLVDGNSIIKEAIQNVSRCDTKTESYDVCLWKFRQKYADIYNLAYTLGDPLNSNLVSTLKYFLQSMPPLLNINSFVFRKKSNEIGKGSDNFGYEGQVNITIYGRAISDKELSDISNFLGKTCFGEGQMSFEKATNVLDTKIAQIGEGKVGVDIEKGYSMNEIKDIIKKHSEDYKTLSNYNKVIKIFELYRIMKENGLCKTQEK